MLATACTVALGTASVPVLAAEVNAENEALDEETEAYTDTVPTPTPQADVEANTEIEATEPEADKEVAEPKLSVTANTTVFDGTQDIVLTFKVDYEGEFTWLQDVFTIGGHVVGSSWEPVSDKEWQVTVNKDHILNVIEKLGYVDGQAIDLDTDGWSVEYDTEDGQRKEISFPSLFVTYTTGDPDNGNGGDNGNNEGGTETPDPEQPDKPVDPENPDNGNGDNGNTETPDPEQPENPDNGNSGDTEKPDGDNTQKPEEQKPITGQTVKPAATNSNTSPKTADMTTVLPVLGTGITSIGVAVAAIFKKRK